MTDLTRPTTWGAPSRLVRCVYACMSIAGERGPRNHPAKPPTPSFNRLLRHGIEEVLA